MSYLTNRFGLESRLSTPLETHAVEIYRQPKNLRVIFQHQLLGSCLILADIVSSNHLFKNVIELYRVFTNLRRNIIASITS